MTRKTDALAALKKLEAQRTKLDTKQQELETRAAAELGRMFLGTGVEAFSAQSLKQIGAALGKMDEIQALEKLGIRSTRAPRVNAISPRQRKGPAGKPARPDYLRDDQ